MIGVISWSIWSVISIAALALLWLYYNWNQYRQEGVDAKLVRRSLFYLIGLIGIALLILRPEITVDSDKLMVGLFTEGSTESDIREFKILYPQGETYTDINEYLTNAKRAEVDTLHIYGIGTSPELSQMLSQEDISIHPPEVRLDLASINLPQAQEYKPFVINGQVAGDVTRASIIDPQGDITALQVDSNQRFNYNSTGLAAGRYLYTLQLREESDSLSIDLPIEVVDSKKYSMLVLLSAPSFEANYFKNYWSELGHSYAQRIRISNDRYTQTFINRPKSDLVNINNKDFRDVDFIMSDGISWNSLTDQERRLIKRRVSNEGATLLITYTEGQVANSIPAIRLSAPKKLNYNIGDKSVSLTGAAISTGSWQKVRSTNVEIAYKRQYGIGHIGYLPIENSYKMLLTDMNKEYQDYWATLLSAFYINTDVPYIIDLPQHVWMDDLTPINIHTRTPLENDLILNDSVSITWINNPLIPNSYKMELTPRQGWNKLQIGSEKPYLFYAYPNKILSQSRQERNAHALNTRERKEDLELTTVKSTPISYWWGYGLAIMGLGLLWLDERL